MTEYISAAPLSARGQIESDERQLYALGYAQELRRRMGSFSNFAVSFTITSDLTMGKSR